MKNSAAILKYSLLACTAYFICMSIAHVTGVKIPVLFIYYDVPSFQYQDNIISFCAFGWACFSYAAAQSRAVVLPYLVAFVGVVLGLSNINLNTDFNSIQNGLETAPYWIQTCLLAGLAGWIGFFYVKSGSNKS